MASKVKFQIVQYSDEYYPVFSKHSWAQDFIDIHQHYAGQSCQYPAVIVSELGEPAACGILLFDHKTAWICGLGAQPGVMWDFAELEMLSHLTDFGNSLQMDNILAMVHEPKLPLFESCGYSGTERMLQFTIGNSAQMEPSAAVKTPRNKFGTSSAFSDFDAITRFITSVIDERRNQIFPDLLGSYFTEANGRISGVLVPGLQAGIYANEINSAKALIMKKIELGYTQFTISDDNPEALQLFSELGFIQTGKGFRVSLGRDNKWKYRELFSSFSHFCI